MARLLGELATNRKMNYDQAIRPLAEQSFKNTAKCFIKLLQIAYG